MQLSPHFSLAELTVTTTGIQNVVAPEHLANLKFTASQMERVRAIMGQPIKVNSGYRSAAVNKAVGGVLTSAHSLGFAVDFVCPAFGAPYDICKALIAAGVPFDQLIHEKRSWVHIGFGPRHRGQVLTLLPGSQTYQAGLLR